MFNPTDYQLTTAIRAPICDNISAYPLDFDPKKTLYEDSVPNLFGIKFDDKMLFRGKDKNKNKRGNEREKEKENAKLESIAVESAKYGSVGDLLEL